MSIPEAEVSLPAAHLAGFRLAEGWRVLSRIADPDEVLEEAFSFGYMVEDDSGRQAFMKALNFVPMVRKGTRGESMMDRLAACIEAYQYEKNLLCHCRDRRLSRVVRVLSHGEVEVPGGGHLSVVPYLVLELADGDVRHRMDLMRDLDIAWALRALRHTTTGLRQLHAVGAAYQDLRPANVLTQEDGRQMKLGDLGRAVSRQSTAPHQKDKVPGDRGFAPPEQLYEAFRGDWEARQAADLYQLGSLAVYLFTRHSMTTLIHRFLQPELRWGRWNGEDYGEVLPYVRVAFGRAMEEVEAKLEAAFQRPNFSNRLLRIIRELCDPDPNVRGHSRDRAIPANRYGLQRFEGELNLLAKRAEMGLLRG
jgi:eukaryotic-like serine/threonine-protein kinase